MKKENWDKLKEFLVEFGSTSPSRDWSLETLPRKQFLKSQKENFEHIDQFTDVLFQFLNRAIKEKLKKK